MWLQDLQVRNLMTWQSRIEKSLMLRHWGHWSHGSQLSHTNPRVSNNNSWWDLHARQCIPSGNGQMPSLNLSIWQRHGNVSHIKAISWFLNSWKWSLYSSDKSHFDASTLPRLTINETPYYAGNDRSNVYCTMWCWQHGKAIWKGNRIHPLR